jgi:hypothetical protein
MKTHKWTTKEAFKAGYFYGKQNGEVTPKQAGIILGDAMVDPTISVVNAFCQGTVDGKTGDTFRLNLLSKKHQK